MSKTVRDTDYSVKHCIQRSQERYGLTINEKDYFDLCKNVKLFLERGKSQGFKNEFDS